MTIQGQIMPPFGTYALSPQREVWRERARRFTGHTFGRAMISFCRKRAIGGLTEPFDVRIEHDIYARLYPTENRTDKRVIAGPQIWDRIERQTLRTAITNATRSPFTFVDAGASSGMYSLYVDQIARAENKTAKIIAIEPGVETSERLKTNMLACRADITVVQVAISDRSGMAFLTYQNVNRGEARLSEPSESHESVTTDTLLSICKAQNLGYVDALKIDIEGHEFPVLKTFFETAPEILYPRILILETRHRQKARPVVEMCLSNGYGINASTRHNSILVKTRHVQA
ncbi:MAG: FkbM family methyltransferase [Hyphomonadaceae bacterium]|nr:FkbM family methyltransferase [Hyphomonadaceae bacterium]MBC6412449.1 FkbM family methyltransferase [Hyphomonadaceae bacterium]